MYLLKDYYELNYTHILKLIVDYVQVYLLLIFMVIVSVDNKIYLLASH